MTSAPQDLAMQKQLDRVEEKVDKVDEKLTSLIATTAVQQSLIERNTQDLEDHMARTEANEEQIEIVRDEQREFRAYIKGMHKLLGLAITILTLASLVGRLFF